MSTEPAAHVDTAAPDSSTDPVRAEIDEWIRGSVAQAGLGPNAEITEVKETPWSTVLAVAAGSSTLYFKAVWPAQRHEVAATALLASRTPHHVPPVVGADEDRGWMLLADAGEPLKRRDTATQLALLPDAIRRYAELQTALMPHVGEFLAAGVPDRRDLRSHLDRLVACYPSEREDTLTDAELAALADLAPAIESMEHHLATVVPASLEHGDLHPGNILVDAEDRTRVFDWGDVSVASPFLSLAVLIGSLEESHGLAVDDPALGAVVDAYLAPFGTLDGANDVRALVRAARLLGSISRGVTWDHVVTHVPPEDHAAFPDPVASSLRDCLRLAAG